MRHLSRPLRAAALALGLVLLGGQVSPAQAEIPPGPSSPAPAPDPVDAYARYEGQSTCDPTMKPGAQYLQDLVVAHWGVGRKITSTRACHIGGTSEHKEGRAIDWGLNAADPAERAAGDAFVRWLTAVGPDGKPGYIARRLGVMYVIWNTQIWNNTSSSATWKPYTGASPHTDHVHVSLSWNGAYQRTSWWSGVAIPEVADTRRYVTRVYDDLFHRAPDAQGLAYWTDAIINGTPRRAVADRITASTEYRTGMITETYATILGRAPDSQGLGAWLQRMRWGMTIQQVQAGFLASPELYSRAGGTDVAWVTSLYATVLGRAASEAEIQDWVTRLAEGSTRHAVALHFLTSVEHLTTVVDEHYQDLLGRNLDPVGLRTWVYAIKAGMREEAVVGRIIGSAEYYRMR